MKKWLVIVLSVLASVLVMSHNASAVNFDIPVKYIGRYHPSYVRCSVDGQQIVQVQGNTCVWGTNVGGNLQGRGLNFIESNPVSINYGYIYEVYITVGTSNEAQFLVPGLWSFQDTTANFNVLSIEQVAESSNLGNIQGGQQNEGYVSTYRFLLRPNLGSNSFPVQVGFPNLNKNLFYLMGENWPVIVDTRIEMIQYYQIVDTSAGDTAIVNAINELKESNQQTVEEEREELEQGQSDLQEAGGDSTSDAQQGTASLIAAIGQAVGVITNASPTNCLINGNMGHLNMGQLDLCSAPVPSFITVIGTLILILCVVPLCISLFNRFIGLFRSFQG